VDEIAECEFVAARRVDHRVHHRGHVDGIGDPTRRASVPPLLEDAVTREPCIEVFGVMLVELGAPDRLGDGARHFPVVLVVFADA